MQEPAQFAPPAILEEVVTTEARLAATVVVAAIALGVIAFLTPWTIGIAGRALRAVIDRIPLPDAAEPAIDRFPASMVESLFVAAIRATTLGVGGLALLVVWGRFDLATAAVDIAVSAVPGVVRLAATGTVVALAFLATETLRDLIEGFAQDAGRMTEHQEGIVLRVSQVGVLVATLLAVLWVWDIDLGGLLVGAGFLGIVVGLAARQTLGSLIAGFVLMLSRPFEIGDWVEIGDHEGIVTDITIISTRLRSFDGERISIPNDRVGNSVVVNRSEEGRLRLRVAVGVDYDVNPERAERVAADAVASVDRIAGQPQPVVIPTGFGDSAVTLELRFWIANPTPARKWRAIQAAIHAVKRAFDREGIKIPFPQRELAGRTETGGFRVVDAGDSHPGSDPASPETGDPDGGE